MYAAFVRRRPEQLFGVLQQNLRTFCPGRRDAISTVVGGPHDTSEQAQHAVQIQQHMRFTSPQGRQTPRRQPRLQGTQIISAQTQVMRQIIGAEGKFSVGKIIFEGSEPLFRIRDDIVAQSFKFRDQGGDTLVQIIGGHTHNRGKLTKEYDNCIISQGPSFSSLRTPFNPWPRPRQLANAEH